MSRPLLLFFLLLCSVGSHAQSPLYFPPLTGTSWATTSPASLGWCPDKIDSLYNFLQEKNTKAFIVLKDGRIVLERYYGTFTQDSLHMWASAGKTLAAFAVGIAQKEGLLNINSPASTYLGAGWTTEPPAKESLITVRHQLTMTTGLNDGVTNLDCTDPACLTYLADAGTRWSYHNAPYTLTHRVVDSAAGPQSWQQFHNTRIAQKTGIAGIWFSSNGYNDVFFSKPRAAARFGLLMLAKGIWNGDTVLGDTAYLGQMTQPSQTLNRGYGYLTWLNGQTTHMLPGTQIVYNGPLVPSAPADLYAALGKDDQKIHVVPSQNLVVVRMGADAGYSQLAPSAFDNELWVKLNAAMCNTADVAPIAHEYVGPWKIFPQPASAALHITDVAHDVRVLRVYDLTGRELQHAVVKEGHATLQVELLPAGHYLVSDGLRGQLFVKQ
jgi:CubicO group peptidase (beta-lactamase class C family)